MEQQSSGGPSAGPAIAVAIICLALFMGGIFIGWLLWDQDGLPAKPETVTVEKTLPAQTVETTREVTKEVTRWRKRPAKECTCEETTLPETGGTGERYER